MKIFRKSSNIALLVFITFLTTFSLGPVLTSCGGSSSGTTAADDSGDDSGTSSGWGSTATYADAQSTSTDSSGQVTVTTLNLGGDIQFEVTGPNGEAISGMTVEYVDTSDGYVLAIVSDPNGVYATSIVSFNYNELSASLAGKGCAELDVVNNKIACAGLCLAAGAFIAKVVIAAVFVKAAIELGQAVYEVAYDPPSWGSFETHSALCMSIEDMFDIADILQGTAGLLTFGGASAVELVVDEVTSGVQDEITSQLAEYIAGKLGLDSDAYYSQRYCWIRYTSSGYSDRYDKWFDIGSTTCVTADADCGSVESTATDPNDVDNDGDGYTENQDDCADFNKLINPGATEICGNDIDEDCDGSTTDADLTVSLSVPSSSGSDRVVIVTGSLSGTGSSGISSALMFVNDSSQSVSVSGGSVSESQIMRCPDGGYENTIQLIVNDRTYCGTGSATYTCTPASGNASDLWVMLTWDDDSDMDLHVFEPGGAQVYWSDMTPSGAEGELDVDDRDGYGPENYTVTSASTGTYTIWVKCYSGCSSTGYTLSVIKGNQSPKEYTGTFTSSNTSTSACTTACTEYTTTLY